jgi:hypothetical protein
MADTWQPANVPGDYWVGRRPYLVTNGEVWIGEPGTHHDTAPAELRGPNSSYGEIYDDQVRPYDAAARNHVSLVEEAWRNHPANRGR